MGRINLLIKEKIFTIISFLAVFNFIFPQPVRGLETAYQAMEKNDKQLMDVMSSLPVVKDKKMEPKKVIRLSVTAYSSSRDECDADPFTTASGARVEDGTIAYNYLPFGTKVRFPEAFGNKVFTVVDRMAAYKGRHIADIWMPSKAEAIRWGVKVLKMEIL